MNKHTLRAILATGLLTSLTCLAGQQANPASAATASRPEVDNRASREAMQIPSHGALMNALVYVAGGGLDELPQRTFPPVLQPAQEA